MVSGTPITPELEDADGSEPIRSFNTSLSANEALRDKVALIVGGTGGIGGALANALITRHCRVSVASRNPARTVNAADESGIDRMSCDVRNASEVLAVFQHVIDQQGRIDIVVNCAGIGRGAGSRNWVEPTMTLSDDDWQEVCETNLRGMFLVARAAAKHMVTRRSGQIVNISSARGAIRGLPFASAYCATKMATRAMFQSLAEELAPFGIRVWSLLPDAVATGLIADTTLGKRGTIDAAKMGSLIADLLAFPPDAALHDLLLAPIVPTSMAAGGIL
jgi:NAD(P)-dependent dehydrogenase (short-subunit alcohol dehydrogenase family)